MEEVEAAEHIVQLPPHFGESLFIVSDKRDGWEDSGIHDGPPRWEPTAIDLDIGMRRPLV